MPIKDWLYLTTILAAILTVVGGVAWIEYRGYCVSEYTCTANITPKAFRR